DGPCGVRLTDVTYTYDGGNRQIVDGLTFDFPPGSCTAILGETGAGKTTLVRLILALIRPQQGRAEIYGTGGRHELSALTRCNFVYVPQGNTLLSGTIRDNLLLGNVRATDDDMRRALETACAGFVFDLPEGLDTVTSESGGGLSEGQAQRIAIARGLLRNRAVMLFDEATSALDTETERQLLHNILSTKEKTVIFITHRPAVVDYCDRVLRVGRTTSSQTE
ncbi:MAG: ATP-binding cassette domain-containing protein, partial [Prevotella sp.]|nr:ATP-binding cassette domain-containing protein [Prevotella sp.]